MPYEMEELRFHEAKNFWQRTSKQDAIESGFQDLN
jgi:hypothetical protein